MSTFSLQYVGKDFSLAEKDFFESIRKEIAQGEKNISLKQRKKYKLEVSRRAQEYVLRLIDVKAEREIDVLRMRSKRSLLEQQSGLLSDLTKAIERHTMQAALNIQQDYKDVQKLARKIDPDDEEFNEEYLRDLRNVALNNLKDVARKRGIDD